MNNVRIRTIAAYQKNAALFNKRLSSVGRVAPFLKKTAQNLPHGARVLDLGCGTGRDAFYFARRGCEVTAVDATPPFVEDARKLCRGLQVRCVCADMLEFSFPYDKFNLVWANASLIHVPKKEIVPLLKRVRQSLVSGGVLAATFHNGRREGIHPGTWIPGRFFASYLKSELEEIITRAGFSIVSLRGVVNQDRKGRWLNLTVSVSASCS